MSSRFHDRTVLHMIFVSIVSGVSAYLMLPMIVSGLLTDFTAALISTAIAIPLIKHFLKEPEGKIDLGNYMGEKKLSGFIIDLIVILIAAMTPAVILMYFLFSFKLILPVPLAMGAAFGLYTGYAAFLYRNRGLYESGGLNINF